MKKLLYLFVAAAAILTGCEKGELVEKTPYETLAKGDPKYSYIKILNLTPGSPALGYFIDGKKFSAALSSTGVENAGWAYNGLFPDLGYAVVTPGTRALTAKVIPSATTDANLEVLTTSITANAGKYYTLYTTGMYTTANKKIGSTVMVEDVSPALDTSKIYIRLVNLYNSSPNIDVVKDVVGGTKLISNIAYGAASDWVSIPALGNGTAPVTKLFFNNAGTTTTLIAAGSSLTLTKGRAYTIYMRGVVGNATYPLAITFYTTFF